MYFWHTFGRNVWLLAAALFAMCSLTAEAAQQARLDRTDFRLAQDRVNSTHGSAFLQSNLSHRKLKLSEPNVAKPKAFAAKPSILAATGGAATIYSDGAWLGERAGANDVVDDIKAHFWSELLGVIMLSTAFSLQWLNERRSVRVDALTARGRAECVIVDAQKVDKANEGHLVYVQGRTSAAAPVVDEQLRDAEVTGCIRLQSTLEILENVIMPASVGNGKSLPQFAVEWTPFHNDLREFRKPAGDAPQPPLNPEPPRGLALGTHTTVSSRVQLGSFVLPEDMVNRFVRFEPAMKYLPKTVSYGNLTFYGNADGYYYARPSAAGQVLTSDKLEHQVGDLRVHFLCVPEGEATVVAVQCCKDGNDTFVAYRPIARGCCHTEADDKKRLVQEGDMSLKDFLGQDVALCCYTDKGQPLVPCCMCFYPCTTLACCCNQEVVTEELMYVSDRTDPLDKAFRQIVPRSRIRVFCYRLAIFGLMYLAMRLVLYPASDVLTEMVGLTPYGDSATSLLMIGATLVFSALVAAFAYAPYLPYVALRYLIIAGIIGFIPTILPALGIK